MVRIGLTTYKVYVDYLVFEEAVEFAQEALLTLGRIVDDYQEEFYARCKILYSVLYANVKFW
mgnify:CR=1 FL=1